MSSGAKEQGPFNEKALFDWKRIKKIQVDYWDKKLEPQLTYVSAYLKACMTLNDHHLCVFFTEADAKFFGSLACVLATLSKLCLILSEAQNLKLVAIAGKISVQGIWITYFTGRRAKLFYHGYGVLDGFADATKILTEVLNELERPASHPVDPLQKMFDLVMSPFPDEEVLKEKENRKL